MLPPDNFQEDPKPVVAHRTSPTNLGLYLLSVVAARDFGWLGTLETVERLEATLATMNGLERFRGHFYNWYDTQRPASARPEVRLLGGQRQSRRTPDRARQRLSGDDRPSRRRVRNGSPGSRTRSALTREALDALADDRRTQTVTRKQLDEALDALAAALAAGSRDAGGRCRTAGGARAARRHRHRHRAHADRGTRRRRRAPTC